MERKRKRHPKPTMVEIYKAAGALITDETHRYRCTFPGCHRSTSRHPYLVGWCYLACWGPGIKDGFYCGPHGDAIEALSGELEHIQYGAARSTVTQLSARRIGYRVDHIRAWLDGKRRSSGAAQ